ncbi:hypothetical protein RND71_024838 [Anisodus tanguticus]|uniref:Uncharacterized protein n=1 Tax=Anisodus tanguticus TaxID=243964 RepID=A0AAE1V5A4_9SOLA|nr:hypothetical protein RND71_024838 [Anisodus tanguticus]
MGKKIEYGDEDQYEPKSDDELNAEGGSSSDEDGHKIWCKLQPIPNFSVGEDKDEDAAEYGGQNDDECEEDGDEEEENDPEIAKVEEHLLDMSNIREGSRMVAVLLSNTTDLGFLLGRQETTCARI